MLVCAAVLAGVGALVLYVSQRYDGQASLPEAAYEEQVARLSLLRKKSGR